MLVTSIGESTSSQGRNPRMVEGNIEQLFFGYMRAYEWLVLQAPCACEVPHLILAAQ